MSIARRHEALVAVALQPDGFAQLQRGFQEPVNSTNEVRMMSSVYSHHQDSVGKGELEAHFANATLAVEASISQMWEAPQSEWVTLFFVVFLLMCADRAFSQKLSRGSFKSHMAVLAFWVMVGLGYNALYLVRYGASDATAWFIGYALEWMLSVDNLFAFQFILRSYRATADVQEKALFWGIVGSMATRCFLFCTIGTLLKTIHYVQFVFGIILIYAGIKSIREDEDDENSSETAIVYFLKRVLGNRLIDSYDTHSNHFFLRDEEDGRWRATLLVPLVTCVILSDIIFAVDSVSAKVAQIPNQYTAYSSSVLALLGLRAMFFVVDDLVRCFELLKYGVCCILIFIGVQLMFAGRLQLPEWVVLLIIVTVFKLCIVASIIKQYYSTSSQSDEPNTAVVTAKTVAKESAIKSSSDIAVTD